MPVRPRYPVCRHSGQPIGRYTASGLAISQLPAILCHTSSLNSPVGDVQEGRPFEADVDEGGLHAGQHAGDDANVDVADQAAVGFAVKVQFLQDALVHDGDPEFLRCRVDQDVFFHVAVMGAWIALPCAAAGQSRRGASP